MRAALMLIAIFSLGVEPAAADAALEARVLRLETQVKALQESLKTAVHLEQVYSLKAANNSCLTSGNTDAFAAKAEVFLGKCDDGNSGPRSWKIGPAQPH